MTTFELVSGILNNVLVCTFVIVVVYLLKNIQEQLCDIWVMIHKFINYDIKHDVCFREQGHRDSANELINRLIKEKDEINSKNAK